MLHHLKQPLMDLLNGILKGGADRLRHEQWQRVHKEANNIAQLLMVPHPDRLSHNKLSLSRHCKQRGRPHGHKRSDQGRTCCSGLAAQTIPKSVADMHLKHLRKLTLWPRSRLTERQGDVPWRACEVCFPPSQSGCRCLRQCLLLPKRKVGILHDR
eukprot:5299608-Prymnesium_polylepis.2